VKTRIEVNELGEFIVQIPEDIMDEYSLEEGDQILWEIDDGFVAITFP